MRPRVSSSRRRSSGSDARPRRRATSNQLDLEKLGSEYSYSLSVTPKPIEADDERKARLAREEADATAKRDADKADADLKRTNDKADADYKRLKDKCLFLGGNLVFVSLLGASFTVVFHSSGDVQKWAMGLVTLLAGGLVGFIAGRLSVKPDSK